MLAGKGGRGVWRREREKGRGEKGKECGSGPREEGEEEIKKWVKDMGDESSSRHLVWPLYSALASHPAFRPSYPSDWPAL